MNSLGDHTLLSTRNFQGKNIGDFAPIKTVNSTTTLTTADSGSFIFLPACAVGYSITLPAVDKARGCYYRFRCTGTQGFLVTITATAGTPVCGSILTTPGGTTAVGSAGVISVRFAAVALAGDMIDIVSDGTVWGVVGISGVNAGITFA